MEVPSVHVQEIMNIKGGDEVADGQKIINRRPQSEEVPKCPRCESGNTKFCYYNNYSLSQPRYFCKACRRYWTKGGTLRNVPIGGGCRRNNKKSAKRALNESHFSHLLSENVLSTSSSSFSSPLSYESNSGTSEISLSMAFDRLQKQCDGDANLGFGFGFGIGHHQQGPVFGNQVNQNQPRTTSLRFVSNFSTSDHQSLYSYGFENIIGQQPLLLPCEDPMSGSVKLELNSNTGLNDKIILSGYPSCQMEKVNNGGLTLESDYNLYNIINENNNLVLGSNSFNVGTGYDEVGRESWNSTGGSALAAAASLFLA